MYIHIDMCMYIYIYRWEVHTILSHTTPIGWPLSPLLPGETRYAAPSLSTA